MCSVLKNAFLFHISKLFAMSCQRIVVQNTVRGVPMLMKMKVQFGLLC
jgi:hypothetical protein